MKEKVLITGGLGYIGSHVAAYLGEDSIIIDNESNVSKKFNPNFQNIELVKDSINNESLNYIFKKFKITAVIHLASLKAVNESLMKPLQYYENNLVSTINILKFMSQYNVNKLIFSSSATVYGNNNQSPFDETMPLNSINPYGTTKIFIEKMISEYSQTNKKFKAISLRYFNPIGADLSFNLCDRPLGKPQNLMPLICESADNLEILKIFGDDYKTPDGTCIRDYIHVSDLAMAHLQALKSLEKIDGHMPLNVGMGKGISVLELIKIFENTNKIKVPYVIESRRDGDTEISFSNISLSKKILNWAPVKNYVDMCKDSWEAYLKNK